MAEILRRDHDFGANDSTIASTLMHPEHAADKLAGWLKRNMDIAAGVAEPTDDPFQLQFQPGEKKAEAGLNLAGLMQAGASPFAPGSAGGTFGTYIGPKAANWNHEAAASAVKMLDDGVDAAEVWKQHLIGRAPDGRLFGEVDDSGLQPQTKAFNRNQAMIEPHEAMGFDNLFAMLPDQQMLDNYPKVSKAQVSAFVTPDTPTSSAFIPSNHGSKPGGEIRINVPQEDDLLNSLLYERQHAIQQFEGSNGVPLEEFLAKSTPQRKDMTMEQRRNSYPLDDFWHKPAQ